MTKGFLAMWLGFACVSWLIFINASDVSLDGWTALCWVSAGCLTLVSTAQEAGLFSIYLVVTLKSVFRKSAESAVPFRLTATQLRQLDELRPQTAMVIPLHRECTTQADRGGLVERLLGILLNSPDWCVVTLIFDSPAEERDNELSVVAAVKRRFMEAGDARRANRLHYHEIRERPPELRTKPGTLYLWLNQPENASLEYVMILDADSALIPDYTRPETQFVLERSVWPFLHDPKLAMVQGILEIPDSGWSSAWGWIQATNSRLVACRFLGTVYSHIYEDQCPCYGHGFTARADLLRIYTNISYLSHDHIEAACLVADGWKCFFATTMVTCESAEDSCQNHVARSMRWARGDAQWWSFILEHWRRLPVPVLTYLVIGILNYAYPFFLTAFVVLTARMMMSGDLTGFASLNNPSAMALAAMVAFSLVGTRVLVSRSVSEVIAALATMVVSALIAPTLMIIEAGLFVTAGLGSMWTVRKSRVAEMTPEAAFQIMKLCAPPAALGVVLHWILGNSTTGQDSLLLMAAIHLMMLGPVIAVLISVPLKKGGKQNQKTCKSL